MIGKLMSSQPFKLIGGLLLLFCLLLLPGAAGADALSPPTGLSAVDPDTSFRGMDGKDFQVSWTPSVSASVCRQEGSTVVTALPEPEFAGGDGSAGNPYQVATAQQLQNVNNHLAACYIQTADFDMGSMGSPIGTSSNKFTGTYDGGGHTISHLSIVSGDSGECVGLFGSVDNATIRKLGLVDINIKCENTRVVGGLVGKMGTGSTISNCYSSGSVSGLYNVGGLVGSNKGGSITKCYNTATVKGVMEVGGLAGSNSYNITDCYNTGTVIGEQRIGGLAGSNTGTIRRSYGTGMVKAEPIIRIRDWGGFIGGLVGNNWSAEIYDSYSAGTVDGGAQPADFPVFTIGGLVGGNSDGASPNKVINCFSSSRILGAGYKTGGFFGATTSSGTSGCYWDASCFNKAVGEGSADGITGLSGPALRVQSNYAGWDFDNTWTMGASHPVLKWQTGGSPVVPTISSINPKRSQSGGTR